MSVIGPGNVTIVKSLVTSDHYFLLSFVEHTLHYFSR